MKNQMRSCTICGSPFTYVTKPGRPPAVCSLECKELIPTTRIRVCSVPSCGTKFSLDDETASPPYFCSRRCRTQSKYSGRQCKYCRNEIPSHLDDGRNNFCSYQCIMGASDGIVCAVCNRPVEVKPNPPWQRVQRYCSTACREVRYQGHEGIGASDNGNTEEALSYWASMPERDMRTNTYLQLATTNSGGPFLKVRPNNLPADFLKQCSPQLRRGIKFREHQVKQIIEAHSDKEYLPEILMQVSILQYEEAVGSTFVPVPPSSTGYLPSLAEVFPFLSDEARFLLRKHNWVKRATLYYRNTPSHRSNKVVRLRENVRKELTRLATDQYPKDQGTQTAFTRQCAVLYTACRELAMLFQPVDVNLYVPQEWIPELTYREAMSPENNFTPKYGLIQEVVIDETVRWTQALPKNHKPFITEGGRPLWNKLLIQQPLDPVTFAYWFWKMNVEENGMAKPWILERAGEFRPDDC